MTDYHRSSTWATFTKKARPILRAALPLPCVNAYAVPGCRGVVMPGEQFDVAHLPGRSAHLHPWSTPTLADVGAAHRACNRTDGARIGRQKQLDQKRRARGGRDERLPQEGSGW